MHEKIYGANMIKGQITNWPETLLFPQRSKPLNFKMAKT